MICTRYAEVRLLKPTLLAVLFALALAGCDGSIVGATEGDRMDTSSSETTSSFSLDASGQHIDNTLVETLNGSEEGAILYYELQKAALRYTGRVLTHATLVSEEAPDWQERRAAFCAFSTDPERCDAFAQLTTDYAQTLGFPLVATGAILTPPVATASEDSSDWGGICPEPIVEGDPLFETLTTIETRFQDEPDFQVGSLVSRLSIEGGARYLPSEARASLEAYKTGETSGSGEVVLAAPAPGGYATLPQCQDGYEYVCKIRDGEQVCGCEPIASAELEPVAARGGPTMCYLPPPDPQH